jgi:NAD(P)H-flavin reductase
MSKPSPITDETALLLCIIIGLLTVGLAYWKALGSKFPPLSKSYTSFPIISSRIVNNISDTSDGVTRPVLFIVIGVSTVSLPTGAHVKLKAVINGEEIVRSYTPTKFNKGQCEIMIRIYPEGAMSQYLSKLSKGDAVTMMGPTGIHRYGIAGPGVFLNGKKELKCQHIGMLAGGTGITPMLQIINSILDSKKPNRVVDNTTVSLVVFSTTVDDVMLWERVNELAVASKGQVRVKYVVSNAMSDKDIRKYENTYGVLDVLSMRSLSKEDIEKLVGCEGKDSVICQCGPNGFVEHVKKVFGKDERVLTW